MRQKYDEGYLDLVAKIKEKKPKYYGVLMAMKYSSISISRVYDVINKGIQDWEVVNALCDVLDIKKEEAV